jgi:hypothetical protein
LPALAKHVVQHSGIAGVDGSGGDEDTGATNDEEIDADGQATELETDAGKAELDGIATHDEEENGAAGTLLEPYEYGTELDAGQ